MTPCRQVVAVDNVRGRALYKVVPRVDLQALNNKQNGDEVVKRKFRPPARFFSLDEAKCVAPGSMPFAEQSPSPM